jgi:hypothetical protein
MKALFLFLLASPAFAATTYIYTGQIYNSASCIDDQHERKGNSKHH